MNQTVIARLKQLRQLGWNRRVLSYDDFLQACEVAEVTVLELAFRRLPGIYTNYCGWPIIGLRKGLREPRRSLVAWHEMGHHLLHAPGIQCYGRHAKTD